MDEKIRTWANFCARAILLIMIPFILGTIVFPHTQNMDGQLLRSPQESRNAEEIAYSFSHSGNDISVPQRVNAIFPLADYLDFAPLVSHSNPFLCFQDNDSYLILADGTKYDPEFAWTVDLNNKTRLIVLPDTINCTAIQLNGSNDYKWYVNVALPTNDPRFKGNLTFVPQTMTYPRIIMDYGLLQGLIMIPVCYLFVWYPAAGIWKKIHKGILEQ
jgi:hypothetical protein